MVGLVERTEKRKLILIPVKDRSKETLHGIIYKHVLKGTTIHADMWKGYDNLSDDYILKRVNHSEGFKNPDDGTHTNTIEGNWAPLKQYVPKRWRTKQKIYLPLALYMERRNSDELSFIKNLIQNFFVYS